MGVIRIEGMQFYAFHGCFKDEREYGNKFTVDLKIETDCSKAAVSDKLEDALDYQKAYMIVKEQMEHASFLLENVCLRILDALHAGLDGIELAEVKVSKLSPPVSGAIDCVSVTLSR